MTQLRTLAWLILALSISACGGSSDKPPVTHDLTMTLDEDTAATSAVIATDPDGDALTYVVGTMPAHGVVTLDAASGAFTYTPHADYFGLDSIRITAMANGKRATALVTITVTNIPDAPRLQAITDHQNSAYSLEADVPIDVVDPDGDPIQLTALVADPDVADVEVSADSRTLLLTPRGRGTTTVTVSAADTQFTVSDQFQFTVDDVTKSVSVSTPNVDTDLVTMKNHSDRSVDFTLSFNGHMNFETINELVAHVAAMAPEIPGEGLERKLWRFIRDNSYHDNPLSNEYWLLDSWATVNSIGSGFCSHFAGTYVQAARVAGYSVRMWDLSGHVVPEIQVDGQWRMLDPDFGIYYYNRSGQIASIADLEADPDLIEQPVTPLFPNGFPTDAYPIDGYSSAVAEIYASAENNKVATGLMPKTPSGSSRIVLPPGATLSLPGLWTAPLIGVDGVTTIKAFSQGAMELPAGWIGTVQLPWVLWSVQGTGTLSIGGVNYSADTDELREKLKNPGAALRELEITSNAEGLRLVFLINPIWHKLKTENEVQITGLDVWAVNIGSESKDAAPPEPTAAIMRSAP